MRIKQEPKIKKSKIIFPFIIGMLILGNVLVTIFSTAEGTKLTTVENHIADEKKQNRELSSRLVSESSLTAVKEDVDQNGFVEPQNIVYLQEEPVFAKLPGQSLK